MFAKACKLRNLYLYIPDFYIVFQNNFGIPLIKVSDIVGSSQVFLRTGTFDL